MSGRYSPADLKFFKDKSYLPHKQGREVFDDDSGYHIVTDLSDPSLSLYIESQILKQTCALTRFIQDQPLEILAAADEEERFAMIAALQACHDVSNEASLCLREEAFALVKLYDASMAAIGMGNLLNQWNRIGRTLGRQMIASPLIEPAVRNWHNLSYDKRLETTCHMTGIVAQALDLTDIDLVLFETEPEFIDDELVTTFGQISEDNCEIELNVHPRVLEECPTGLIDSNIHEFIHAKQGQRDQALDAGLIKSGTICHSWARLCTLNNQRYLSSLEIGRWNAAEQPTELEPYHIAQTASMVAFGTMLRTLDGQTPRQVQPANTASSPVTRKQFSCM